MRRAIALALVAALAFGATGCSAPGVVRPPSGESTHTAPAPAKVDPFAALPVEGVHEKAAVAALPAAVSYAAKVTKQQGRKVTDLSGGKATLVAYTIQAVVRDKSVLLEVRADGKVYPSYGYPTVADPAHLAWRDAKTARITSLAQPDGPGEMAAVGAVKTLMDEAMPDKAPTIAICGYDFYWIKPDGTPVKTPGGSPFTMSVDPAGDPSSWSM